MDPESKPESQPGSDPSLGGRRIVITRSDADNRSLAAQLSALGAEVIQLPLVEVLPAEDGGLALEEAAGRLSDYRWVVLTSVNGVEALRAALLSARGERPWPVDAGADVEVAPVGPVTAAAARAAGMRVGDAPPTATASGLVEAFSAAAGAGCRVLAPLAELAGPIIVDGLTAKGYAVDRVSAYRTVAPQPVDPKVVELVDTVDVVDAVAFFSPSVVDRFVHRVERRPTAICVGPSTAERASAQGFTDITMAYPHSEAGVIQALCKRFGPVPH